MPRIIQTNPAGTRITPWDYLKASAKTPFGTGVISEIPGGRLYGYSGMVNFDAFAQPTYNLLDFTLDYDALFNLTFNCDWNVVQASGSDTGCEVLIAGVSVIRAQWEIHPASVVQAAAPGWTVPFIVPANRNCTILVLNPDASADLLQANVTLTGVKC